jgi:hypothetical protein
MACTAGDPNVAIGLIDGPVVLEHADLIGAKIRSLPGDASAGCTQVSSAACGHGTFVAGILAARRGSAAPGGC